MNNETTLNINATRLDSVLFVVIQELKLNLFVETRYVKEYYEKPFKCHSMYSIIYQLYIF